MKILIGIVYGFTIGTLVMIAILKSQGFVVIHKDDIAPEPIATIKACTSEQALQWWVGEENLTKIRQRLCSNNFSKSK